MLGLRFLLQMAMHCAMFVLRPVMQFYTTAAKSIADARLVRERDTFLKRRFVGLTETLTHNLNIISPTYDHKDAIKVLAVMPTASLKTRLEGREEVDAFVIFCYSDMTVEHMDHLHEQPKEEVFKKAQITTFMTFNMVFDPQYYDTIVLIMMSQFAQDLDVGIMKLIADYYATDYCANLLAFWHDPVARRLLWMRDGINKTSDNTMCFDDAVKEFYRLSDKLVDSLKQ